MKRLRVFFFILSFFVPLRQVFSTEPSPPTTQGGVYSGTLQVGRTIVFSGKENQNGIGSYDNDSFNSGFAETWRWDFDYKNNTFTDDAVTTSYLVNYSYAQAGIYTVALYYIDNDNQQGQLYTFNVTIQDGGNATYYIDQRIISQTTQFLSRDKNADYYSGDPNFSTSIVYTEEKGFADVTSSAGWTSSGDVTFGHYLDAEATIRIGGPAWSSVQRPVSTDNIVARVDFYPDNTTGGTPHVLAFDGSNYRFCVQYNPTTDKFQLQTNKNGSWNTPSDPAYQFLLSAPPNQWYTVEIEKNTDGKCYAWVYRRGESRKHTDRKYDVGFPTSWVCTSITYSDYDYFYISNYYAGSYSQSKIYSDGLGRTMQTHQRIGTENIISHVNYSWSGRDSITWRPYKSGLSDQSYDPFYASRTQSEYGGLSNPYTATEYFPDPLGRVQYVKPSGWSNTNEITEYKYGSAAVNGITHRYSDVLQKPGSQTAVRVQSRSYTDNLGRTVKSVTGNEGDTTGIISKSLYSITGQLLTLTDPDNLQSSSTYDFLTRTKTSTTPDAGTVNYIYDSAGRLRFMLDAAGAAANPDNVLYWKYDIFGRVIEKGYIVQAWDTTSLKNNADYNNYPSTPATWRKKYTYDGSSLMFLTKGKAIKVETNNDGDVSSEVEESYDYDKFGNTIAVHQKVLDFSPNTNSTFYTYDHLGRVMAVQYPIKPTDVVLQNTTVTSGQNATAQSTNVLTAGPSYTINSGGSAHLRATNIVKLMPGFSAKGGSTLSAKIESAKSLMTVRYSYNQLGQMIAMGTPNDSDYYAAYTYYADGAIKEEKINNSSKTVTYQFNHVRRYLTGIAADVFTETLGYDNAGYNNNETFYNGLVGSTSFSYAYAGSPSNYSYKYQYDKYGRLEIADNSVDNAADIGKWVDGKNTYYNNGRIDHFERGSSSFYYNYYANSNKLQNADGTGNDYTYDANGNTLTSAQKNITSIAYDPFYNKATAITKSGAITRYQYDGAGERILKVESSIQTAYICGLSSYPIVEKFSNGYERYYIYGPKGLVAMQDSSSVWFTLRDHLGSTRIVLNQSNTVVASYDYDPYGKKFRSSVNTNVDYQFTGQEYDDEILLHNYRARMYDHDVAQFYATDPEHETFNPYSYVGNNPVSYTDPTGRKIAGYWDAYWEALAAIEARERAMIERRMSSYGGGGSGLGYGGMVDASGSSNWYSSYEYDFAMSWGDGWEGALLASGWEGPVGNYIESNILYALNTEIQQQREQLFAELNVSMNIVRAEIAAGPKISEDDFIEVPGGGLKVKGGGDDHNVFVSSIGLNATGFFTFGYHVEGNLGFAFDFSDPGNSRFFFQGQTGGLVGLGLGVTAGLQYGLGYTRGQPLSGYNTSLSLHSEAALGLGPTIGGAFDISSSSFSSSRGFLEGRIGGGIAFYAASGPALNVSYYSYSIRDFYQWLNWLYP